MGELGVLPVVRERLALGLAPLEQSEVTTQARPQTPLIGRTTLTEKGSAFQGTHHREPRQLKFRGNDAVNDTKIKTQSDANAKSNGTECDEQK